MKLYDGDYRRNPGADRQGSRRYGTGRGRVRLMFEMYAEPETSFGDITRYFEERGIKVYGKSLTRSYLSQLLRNPVYAQADLEMYEFFKSQGTVVVNDAADFAGTNGCYLYQGRDVKEDKDKSLKDQILVIAPHEGLPT